MLANHDKANDCRGARICASTILFIWFIINILQAIFTEIHEDEAYYALFGEHLAWGYFDHPPMVAMMTFLSGLLFKGTLGVRFFTVVASCLTLWVMWVAAIEKAYQKKPAVFFVLAFSVVMLNLYGFVTTPDASLLLFSALFLLMYQRYLADNSWKNALLMGMLMALMVYSKYHAFLFLGLIVLSNIKLLKDGKFWVACLVALALLMPHVLWQINADFPSFRYHLSQRSEPFRWSYFLEYLPNQLLVFNPFVFGAVVYVFLRRDSVIASRHCEERSKAQQSRDIVFEKGLKCILIGFFFFFWLMTFRGHVEPHWTAVAAIPAIILVYRKALVDSKLRKYVKWVVAPSLLLVLAMRIALLTPLSSSFGFYGKENHYKAIETVAGERPVLFQGSFQQPALYHYFTGKESSTLRSFYDRYTQYDLWQFDTAWIGKPAFVYGSLNQEYHIENEAFTGCLTDNFQTANRVETLFEIAGFEEGQPLVVSVNDTLKIDFSLHNTCGQPIEFQSEMMPKLVLVDDNEVRYGFYEPIVVLQPDEVYRGRFAVVLGAETRLGSHRLLLCIGDRYAIFGALGDAVDVVVEAP